MMEQYNNVQFDEMPNFGNMMKSKHNDRNADDKYNTLYDELLDKCHPGKFIRGDAFDKEIFDKANLIYAELLSKKGDSDDSFIKLRNRAIIELGIHISTRKKVDYLMQYLNPYVYVDLVPYDAVRVAEAANWYERLLQCKEDIRELDNLEIEANGFIQKRKAEEKLTREHDDKKKFIIITAVVLSLYVWMLLIIKPLLT